MLNLLALSFYCDTFKRNPNIRIFFNDKFIDEYEIYPHRYISGDNEPNLKIYQLDLPHTIKENFIKLEIQNSDSNYNNGFMTKSTLLKMNKFLLMPVSDFDTGLAYLHKKKFNSYQLTQYDLIPYTSWIDIENTHIEDVYHQNIGNSGYFVCNLIEKVNFFRPVRSFDCLKYDNYGNLIR